jgi:hypothetical protein
MKLTPVQFEAIIWAMFAVENEIEHINFLMKEDLTNQKFYEDVLKKRHEHWKALKDLISDEK